MSLIEGIGDEVTVCVTILILATTLMIAWFSTQVRDRPLPQLRIIQTTITSIRRGQQNTGNVTVTNEPARGSGHANETSQISASEESQETSSERTLGNSSRAGGSVDEPFSQVTQNTEVNITGASDTNIPLSRTAERSQTETTEEIIDDTDGRQVKSEECVQKDAAREQCEVLGDTAEETSSPGESISTSRVENLDQNVLRNRQTGQTYPTLPPFNASDTSPSPGAASSSENVGGGDEEARNGNHSEPDSGQQTREGSICIRVKFSNDEQRIVQTSPQETLGQFRRQHFVEEIEAGKLVRFISNGQLLADDSQTLAALNLTDNAVLHCHVTQGQQPIPTRRQVQAVDVDLGQFMIPLFGFILGFVWYFRLRYRYMFNATSTMSLVGVTVLFVLAVLAAWRG